MKKLRWNLLILNWKLGTLFPGCDIRIITRNALFFLMIFGSFSACKKNIEVQHGDEISKQSNKIGKFTTKTAVNYCGEGEQDISLSISGWSETYTTPYYLPDYYSSSYPIHAVHSIFDVGTTNGGILITYDIEHASTYPTSPEGPAILVSYNGVVETFTIPKQNPNGSGRNTGSFVYYYSYNSSLASPSRITVTVLLNDDDYDAHPKINLYCPDANLSPSPPIVDHDPEGPLYAEGWYWPGYSDLAGSYWDHMVFFYDDPNVGLVRVNNVYANYDLYETSYTLFDDPVDGPMYIDPQTTITPKSKLCTTNNWMYMDDYSGWLCYRLEENQYWWYGVPNRAHFFITAGSYTIIP